MEQTKPERKYNISLVIMTFCIFVFTVGQYIPIDFVDTGFRALYYFVLYILLVGTASRTVFKLIYKPKKENISSARLYSILVGLVTFIVFGLETLGMSFVVWSEATTFYVRKDNPKIKIISRYLNEGAFGGGTEPSDYHIVLQRPLTAFFKLVTSIDTTTIIKSEWRKPDVYNLDDIKGRWYISRGLTNQILDFKNSTVYINNKDSIRTLNYAIVYDSLLMWNENGSVKTSNKILSLEKDNFMFEDNSETSGIKLYYRTSKQ